MVLHTECVCDTAPARLTFARSRCNGVSAEGEPAPPTTVPFASTRTKLSGDNVPLCNPVAVMVTTKGSRLTHGAEIAACTHSSSTCIAVLCGLSQQRFYSSKLAP